MNGPKVRKVLKAVPVPESVVHKLISRFLEREGQDDIMLNENLTRLGSICQSMGGPIALSSEPAVKPVIKKEEAVKEDPSSPVTSKEAKRSAKKAAKEAKKSAKKEKKEEKKEAKKAKKEAKKEKRKRESEGGEQPNKKRIKSEK